MNSDAHELLRAEAAARVAAAVGSGPADPGVGVVRGEGRVALLLAPDEPTGTVEERRVALRHCGSVDPSNIDEYIAVGGYAALARALKNNPDATRTEIAASGLLGPAARPGAPLSPATHVICNAGQGDPAAGIDLLLLEADPHAVLEGLLITAHAVGATAAHVYLGGDHPVATERLTTALTQMRERDLVGAGARGSTLRLQIELHQGLAASILADDVALIRAIQGDRPSPLPRVDAAESAGLYGQPTLIVRAEILARVSGLLARPDAGPSVCVSVAGEVRRPVVVEVPPETTLRQVIEMAGGILGGSILGRSADGAEPTAVKVGGATGGWLPRDELDTAVGPASAAVTLAVAGSGFCAVDLARNDLAMLERETCGLCVVCREGTMQMAEILDDVATGNARAGDVDLLHELAENLAVRGPCVWGREAARPVLSTLAHFRTEYEAHVRDRHCPAGVCAVSAAPIGAALRGTASEA